MEQRYIYIIISQTGTILSQILKTLTGAQYNHSSISLCRDIEKMYSFGRLNPYNPIWGGFVQESIHSGTFKRFKNTQAIILRKEISQKQYHDIETYFNSLYENSELYGYNYLGLILAGIKVKHESKSRYYCSEFVKDTLIRFNVATAYDFPDIVKPIDFIKLSNCKVIYTGKLKDYPKSLEVKERKFKIPIIKKSRV